MVHWSVKECKGFKATGGKDESGCDEFLVHHADGKVIPWYVTDKLIWACGFLDLSGITPLNWREFAVRLAYY